MINLEVKCPMLQFTQEDIIAIMAQFNRTIENVDTDIDCIKIWIRAQPHLARMPVAGDLLVLNLLVTNKFSIEKTKVQIDNLYSCRSTFPKIFANCFPSRQEIQNMRKMIRVFPLKHLVRLNRVLFHVVDEVPHSFDPYPYLAKICMDWEAMVHINVCSNVDVIFDYTDSNFAYWSSFTPVSLKWFMVVVQKVFANRFQTARIIGLPKVGSVLVNMCISCLSEKLQNRVILHSVRTEMVNYYPREQLPVEYGGEGAPYRQMSAQYDEVVDDFEDHFRTINDCQVDMELRPTRLENDELLGYYGNFRLLDVD